MAKLPALPYVRASVSQGLSANQSYRNYQALAHENDLQGMRRQDYLRLYSQTRGLRGQAAEALAAPKDAPFGGLTPQKRGTITATGFGHWVGVYQRSAGGSDFFHTPFLVKSQTPMTPAEAEAQALDWLEKEPDTYNRTTLGVSFLGVEEFEPLPK